MIIKQLILKIYAKKSDLINNKSKKWKIREK